MRKIAAVLMMLAAVTLFADGKKAAEVAGNYQGPDESYGLVLEVAPDGKLRGNYVEMGRLAVLNAIEVKGSQFTARASFDDGSLRVLSGSVTSRGIRIADTFFQRL